MAYTQLYGDAQGMDLLLMTLGTISAMGSAMYLPIFCILFGQMIDALGSGSVGATALNKVALASLYLACSTALASYIQTACWTWTAHRQAARLRERYLYAVLRKDVAFFDTHTRGGLLQPLNEDAAAVQTAIEKTAGIIQHLTTFLAITVVALVTNWDLALMMIATLPLHVLAHVYQAKATLDANRRASKAYSYASGCVVQATSQIRTVAAYGAEERHHEEYTHVLEEPTRAAVKLCLVQGLFQGMEDCMWSWIYGVALIYGAFRVSGGHTTGGNVATVVWGLLYGGYALGLVSGFLEPMGNGHAARARISDIISRVPTIDPEQDGDEIPDVQGHLELRDVCFAYPSRP